MFESHENYKWNVPAPMREAGVQYWRTVTLAWTMPWFVMAIRWSKEDALQSFLISNEHDLVSALQSIGGRGVLEFLARCDPAFDEAGFSWSMTYILEVWLGGDIAEHTMRAVLIDREHRSISGPSFESGPGLERSRLIARVGDVIQPSLQEETQNPAPSLGAV